MSDFGRYVRLFESDNAKVILIFDFPNNFIKEM